MISWAKYSIWRAGLFVYGAIAHLSLFRLYVHFSYPPGADRSFVDDPLTNGALTLLGGTFVAFFMLRLLRRARTGMSLQASSIMLRGAALGVAATVLTLQSLFILASIFLTFSSYKRAIPGGMGLLQRFIVSLIEIEGYGIGPTLFSVPFDLCYGLIVGVSIVRTSRSYSPG